MRTSFLTTLFEGITILGEETMIIMLTFTKFSGIDPESGRRLLRWFHSFGCSLLQRFR